MFNIPKVDYKPFKRHFIRTGIVEIRFEPISFDWESNLDDFKNDMASLGYPTVKKLIRSEFLFNQNSDGKTDPTLKIATAQLGYQATTENGDLTVELKNDRIVFICQAYSRFSELWKSISTINESFSKRFNVTLFDWIGIRKINEIAVVNESGEYNGEGLNPMFFAPINKGALQADAVVRGVNQYVVSQNEMTSSIRTSVNSQPKVGQYTVTIDLDINSKFENSVNFADIEVKSKSMNEMIYNIYCWVISDELLDELNKEG